MPEFEYKMIISENFINKIKDNNVNEKIVLEIINKSKKIFEDKIPFEYLHSQSNGEPDYISLTSKKQYDLDAKLFIPRDFMEKMNFNKSIPFEILIKYWDLLYESVQKNSLTESFEKDFNDLINTINKSKKKNIILFYPFPILKLEKSISLNISMDSQEYLIDKIMTENNIEKDIYLLSYTFENKFYIKKINNKNSEYIEYEDYKNKYLNVIYFR